MAICGILAGCLTSAAPGVSEDDATTESHGCCNAVYGMTVSYGEKWLAYYGTGKSIHLQELPHRKPAGKLIYHNCEVSCAVFHPSESTLFACYVDGSVVRWSHGRGAWRPQRIGRLNNELLACAVSATGDFLAVGNCNGDVAVWSLNGKPQSLRLLKHGNAIWNLTFTPDGGQLAAVGADGMFKLWNVDSWTATDVASGHRGVVSQLAFSEDGVLLATAGYDGMLRMIDRQSGRLLWSVKTSPRGIRSIGFSADGAVVAIGSLFSGQVQLRGVRSGQSLSVIPAHRTTVTHVQFLADGTLLTSSHDGTIEAFVNALERDPG